MRCTAAVVIALGMAGCAGMQHAMEHYSGIQPVNVPRPDDTYLVYDKPADNRMMVSSSIGAAAAQGAGSGLFFGAVDMTPPLPAFQAAAEQHLLSTGRGSCRITQGYLLVKPQFEFRYTCEPAAPAAAASLPSALPSRR